MREQESNDLEGVKTLHLLRDLRAFGYDLLRAGEIAAHRGVVEKIASQYARNPRERGAIVGVEIASNTLRYPSFQFDEHYNLKPASRVSSMPYRQAQAASCC